MRENLDKYFSGELTTEEKDNFLRDVVGNPLLKEEFIETQNLIGLSELSPRKGDFNIAQSSLLGFKQQIRNKKLKRYILSTAKYAAVIAVVILSTWFVSKQYFLGPIQDAYTEIEVPQGHRVHIRLEDGTTVWLNSRSKLRYPNAFTGDKRIVQLDGDGFFSVNKNESKPFIVKTSLYDVQVLGTKFNVFNYSESSVFETTLHEGAVKVYKEGCEKNAVRLHPNEQVILNKGILEKRYLDNWDITLWEDGYIIFDNESFDNIIKKLELYYNVQFVIRNEKALKNTYTGNFNSQDSVVNILDAIQKVQKFSFDISADKKIIYINE